MVFAQSWDGLVPLVPPRRRTDYFPDAARINIPTGPYRVRASFEGLTPCQPMGLWAATITTCSVGLPHWVQSRYASDVVVAAERQVAIPASDRFTPGVTVGDFYCRAIC